MKKSGLLSANIFASVLMLSQFFLMIVLFSFLEPLQEALPALFEVTGLLIANEVFAVFVPSAVFAYFFCRHRGLSIRGFLRIKPLSGRNIIIILLMSICVQPMMSILSLASAFIFANGDAESTFAFTREMEYLQMVVAIGVVPALFEELAMRGVILGAYGDELDIGHTLLINGLFFGLIHLNPQQLLYAMALGVFFSYVVMRTGSIFAGIIAHFTVNFTQVTIVSAALNAAEGYGIFEDSAAMTVEDALAQGGAIVLGVVVFLALLIGSTVLFFYLLAIFTRRNPIANEADEETEETDYEGFLPSDELPELSELKLALENRNPMTAKFYVSFIAAIAIYMAYISILDYGLRQIVMLLGFFTAVFFIFFLFRVRS